jgi:hypothetical protein
MYSNAADMLFCFRNCIWNAIYKCSYARVSISEIFSFH